MPTWRGSAGRVGRPAGRFVVLSMLRSLWLLFAQTVTVGLAVLFTLAVLRPEWLPSALRESTGPARIEVPSRSTGEPVPPPSGDASILSYASAANRAIPSVVNVLTNQDDAEGPTGNPRSEEHTSELQSREKLVCRLLLEKKKRKD